MHPWLLLLIAILFEVSGTTCMKLSRGFTQPLPTVLMFLFYGIGFIPLNLAIRHIDLSVAYAVWSGLGMAIITVVGIFFLREQPSVLKFISIALIMAGVIGLNLSGGVR